MRGRVIKCALAIAGFGVVASAATALSTRAPTPFDQTLTLAGGPNVDPGVDPDAPIATARYGDKPRATAATPAIVDLAGAPSATTLAGGLAPAAAAGPVELAQAAPIPPIQTLGAPRPRAAAPARSAPIRSPSEIRAAAPPTRVLGLVRSSSSARPVTLAKIEDIDIRPFSPPDARAGSLGLSVNASSLMGKMRPASEDAKKGRWILFAASSGKSLSLNVIRDTIVGWRGAGWAEERIARLGTHQLGMGWRKGRNQVSLSATRRNLRVQGYSDRDVVYGVSLSVNGR
jgi:hypothetical protein